ncbi:hypothetical protein BDV59DRAFT_174191 [Aspergillus ambiguus]|uniref:uncharacterized protein n=1 Tax=Aspergillus ambiguus TaxID=176160 RepID=UPI003CCD0AD0
MTSGRDSFYTTAYPSDPADYYSTDTDNSMDRRNPYYRFLSPSPSRRPSRPQRSRSTSVPSVYFTGYLEHYPVESRRRKEYPTYYYPHYQHNPPRRHRTTRQPARYHRNSQLVNPDVIDRLDDAADFHYHHEGPYDAVYAEKNHISKLSPVEAVRESNAEALKATPSDKIRDCLDSHRPLDGVAYYPPGTTDREGQTYVYEEGPNMMNEFGNFMRCPGMKFTDEDFKNDPFYNSPLPKPFASLRKALSIRRHSRRGTS